MSAEAISILEGIRDQLDSLRYAAPEMADFWLNEIGTAVNEGISELGGEAQLL